MIYNTLFAVSKVVYFSMELWYILTWLFTIVENAIKHNEHTAAHPLNIDIFSDGQNITVQNNKRLVPVPESTQIGIHNIEERYRLLTRQKVKIEDGNDTYSITIPAILS